MLKQLYELAERLLGMTRDIRANKAGIEKLESRVQTLSEAVRELAFELRRLRENEAHEREKLVLRLENALLHSERSFSKNEPRRLGASAQDESGDS